MKAKVVFATIFILTVWTTLTWLTNIVEAQVVTDGLFSYWTFDRSDIDDETVKDVWGNNHGTMFGDLEIVDGQVGQALFFDGVDDYAEVPDSEEFRISEETITVEAWIQIESLPQKWMMVFSKFPTEYEFGIASSGEPVCFFAGDNSHQSAEKELSEGGWWHLVWIWNEDSGQSYIYVNAEQVGDYKTGDKSADTTNPVQIGRDPRGAYYFHGSLDEVRFYNRALNETEVKKNYAAKGLAVVSKARTLTITWGRVKSF